MRGKTAYKGLVILLLLWFPRAQSLAEGVSSPEVQAASEVGLVFAQACMHNLTDLQQVRAWAASKQLPEVTAPAARKVYIGGGDDGVGWIVKTETNTVVLALRSGTGACAVFGEHGDPDTFSTLYDAALKVISAPLGPTATVTPEPDKIAESDFGQHIGKVRLVFHNGRKALLTLLTYEKSGGPFQISMQVAVSPQ